MCEKHQAQSEKEKEVVSHYNLPFLFPNVGGPNEKTFGPYSAQHEAVRCHHEQENTRRSDQR